MIWPSLKLEPIIIRLPLCGGPCQYLEEVRGLSSQIILDTLESANAYSKVRPKRRRELLAIRGRLAK